MRLVSLNITGVRVCVAPQISCRLHSKNWTAYRGLGTEDWAFVKGSNLDGEECRESG